MKNYMKELEFKTVKYLSEILDLKYSLKQKEIEKKDMMKEFFLGIIDIIDTCERKEENISEKYQTEGDKELKFLKSIISIKNKLLKLLEKYGVTVLDFPDNKLILGFSKVVETEPDPFRENDKIISIIRNGYIKGSELIREAELVVVKN